MKCSITVSVSEPEHIQLSLAYKHHLIKLLVTSVD